MAIAPRRTSDSGSILARAWHFSNPLGYARPVLVEDPGAKLTRLLTELAQKRASDGFDRLAHYDQQRAACAAQLRQVPLVHATSVDAAHTIVGYRSMKTRTAKDARPSDVELYLGIHDVVYTSAGHLYPHHEFAFVFSPAAEEGTEVEATPWDTGNLYRRPERPNLPSPPDPRRREIYLAHSLRAPEYRTYLVEYVASCFACADDYLLGANPRFDDPAGLMTRGTLRVRSRTFEVRFKGTLSLEKRKPLRVFLDEGATNAHRVIRLLKDWGVPYTQLRVDDGTLVDQVRSWIVDHLTNERLAVS